MLLHRHSAAVALCSDDVEFRSPVVHRPYRGREALRPILGAVFTVFGGFHYVAGYSGDDGHVRYRTHREQARAQFGRLWQMMTARSPQ